MTGLPTTRMRAEETASSRRNRAANSVGARWREVVAAATLRFTSSIDVTLNDRRPASR